MANRAIVVGIQGYPELPPELQGPKNDAQKFFKWVTEHGGVDEQAGHAKLILDPDPLAKFATDATPTADMLKLEFDRLEDDAKKNGGVAGDRLYLYLSGHGFGSDLADASLLMANATQDRTRHHIPGRLWADHFYARGYFKEVLMFLDCCRERYKTSPLNGPGTDQAVPPNGARRFYGFAAKFGKLAVERVIDGQMGGVFTATLIDALKGGAAEDDGRVTGESLKAYLYENMKGFLAQDDLDDKDVAKEPDLYCEPPEDQFVITSVPVTKYTVTIPLPAGAEALPRQLIGERDGKKFVKIAESPADGTLAWKLPLVRGTYQLLVNGTQRVITVKGRGQLDVTDS